MAQRLSHKGGISPGGLVLHSPRSARVLRERGYGTRELGRCSRVRAERGFAVQRPTLRTRNPWAA